MSWVYLCFLVSIGKLVQNPDFTVHYLYYLDASSSTNNVIFLSCGQTMLIIWRACSSGKIMSIAMIRFFPVVNFEVVRLQSMKLSCHLTSRTMDTISMVSSIFCNGYQSLVISFNLLWSTQNLFLYQNNCSEPITPCCCILFSIVIPFLALLKRFVVGIGVSENTF